MSDLGALLAIAFTSGVGVGMITGFVLAFALFIAPGWKWLRHD